jgi:thiol-disulfide isomerase/thioredoxin
VKNKAINKKVLLGMIGFTIILFAIILLAATQKQLEVTTVGNNISAPGVILLSTDGTIPTEECIERNLTDKVIMIESRYCGACRVAVPRVKEVEEELGESFIFLDLSKSGDWKAMESFGIRVQYTPTLLVGCDVHIGAYPKEQYKTWIGEFKVKQNEA